MDSEELENKAKLMKKRNVQLVHEHFEEVFIVPHIKNIMEGKRRYLAPHYSCNGFLMES